MSSPEYIRTDAAEDAVSSLELAADFYDQAALDARYWKWFVVALHAGIQGTFALALEGGNGLLVQKPSVMAATLAAHDKGEVPPRPYMDNFQKLYKKLQRRENLRSSNSLPIPASSEQELALASLDEFRDEFLHFNTKSWSIERELIVLRARGSLEVASFLVSRSGAIFWHELNHEERAKSAINRLYKSLNEEG